MVASILAFTIAFACHASHFNGVDGNGRQRRRGWLKVLIWGVIGCTQLITPSKVAHALSPEVKGVLVTGLYGTLGGTAAGLVAYPFTSELKTVFVGSSVGLYLGLAVGTYLMLDRERPGAPLYVPPGRKPPWEQQKGKPVEPERDYYDLNSGFLFPNDRPQVWWQVEVPLARF